MGGPGGRLEKVQIIGGEGMEEKEGEKGSGKMSEWEEKGLSDGQRGSRKRTTRRGGVGGERRVKGESNEWK